jgi:hypothetical protein
MFVCAVRIIGDDLGRPQSDSFHPRVASVHHLRTEATISHILDFKAPLPRVCSPQKVNGDDIGPE